MQNLFSRLSAVILVTFLVVSAHAQNNTAALQRGAYKQPEFFSKTEDSVRKQFERQQLSWPPEAMYVRSFKYDRQLEVWVKGKLNEPYKLFKTYKVCMQSGTMGPKRMEGDYQVPEGFYHINEFNPNSNYHLALGLNYPNTSDRILSDSLRPGGDIYIHGNCVSVGCIPVNDQQIEELYVISSYAKANGEDFIPVHVFPYKYTSRKAAEYFRNNTRNNEVVQKFATQLKSVFDRFEETKHFPIVNSVIN